MEKPEAPSASASADELAHLGDLAVVGRAIEVVTHDAVAQRLVADDGVGVHRGRRLPNGVRVFGEAFEGEAAVADQVERRRRPLALTWVSGASETPQLPTTTVVTPCDDLAAQALAARQHGAVVVRVCIDEAGGEGAAGGDTSRSALAPPRSPTATMRSPVTPTSPTRRGRAGAVEQGGVADDEVAAEGHGRADSWSLGVG